MKKIDVSNLSVAINEKEILKDINISINQGEIIALIGPNGHGKSTFAKTLTKHYTTEIIQGKIFIDDECVNDYEADEISKKGLFIAPQHSEEIPGVLMVDYLKAIINAHREQKISLMEFYKIVEDNLVKLQMNRELLHRFVNFGFSGGEKKKCEILQMKLINPDFAILDEIDSGLDVDSLKIVINEIKNWHNSDKTLIIISHHENLFKEIKPTKVVVIYEGKIAKVGDVQLLEKVYQHGYGWIKKECGPVNE